MGKIVKRVTFKVTNPCSELKRAGVTPDKVYEGIYSESNNSVSFESRDEYRFKFDCTADITIDKVVFINNK